MNDLGYGQQSNPNLSLNLVSSLIFSLPWPRNSFLKLISSHIKGGKFYLDYFITFEDLMAYLIYDVLEI